MTAGLLSYSAIGADFLSVGTSQSTVRNFNMRSTIVVSEPAPILLKLNIIGMSCPSWQWHRTGYSLLPVRTLPVAPLWCDLGCSPQTVVVIKLRRTSALWLLLMSMIFAEASCMRPQMRISNDFFFRMTIFYLSDTKLVLAYFGLYGKFLHILTDRLWLSVVFWHILI